MPAPKSVAVLDAKAVGIEYTLPEVPAEVVYSHDFESGDDGWRSLGDLVVPVAVAGTLAATGTPYKTFTGVATNGRSYTVTAKVRASVPGRNAVLSLSNGAGGSGTPGVVYDLPTDSWTPISATYTSAVNANLYVSSATYGADGETYWDDITITRDAYSETVPDLPLEVIDAEVTLDDSRSPYVEARLTVHTPAEEYLEQIDPRDGLRVQLDAELSWVEPAGRTPQSRTFDLLLHEREVDHETGELRLVLESDEARLIDGGNASATVDDGAEAHQASLRAIVDYVLAKHGAELEPGTDDADFTITDPTVRTNLALNPRGASSTTAWAGSNATVSRLTGLTIPDLPGVTTAIRGTMAAATGGLYHQGDTAAPYVAMAAGKQYRVTVWLRPSVAKTVTPSVQFNTGSSSLGSVNGAPVALTANTWQKVSWVVTAPAGAARGGPYWYSTTAWASGNTIDATGLTVTEGTDEIDFFDGATVDDYYTYAWTGTANASSSTRTRNDNRDPDALKQAPGVTDWDFLDPLIRTAGLRLFCDEQRAWRLVEPASYRLEGETRVSEGTNATRGADTISLQATRPDGSPVWYTGVVVVYRWTDTDGVQHVAYDAAGTGQKVYRIELARPYPGPGLAVSRLAQATGRGRVQDLEALADLGATPGQSLVSTMPATPIQLGQVSAVKWFWAAEGERHDLMAIRSRGLTDTPPTAWAFAEGTWDDVAGIQWNEIDEEGE